MIPKELLGAFKAGHRKSARPFIDEELSLKLLSKYHATGCAESFRHLQYIAKFNNEFHKNVIRKGDDSSLHCTDELRRDCYARNNAMNRDLFTRYELIAYSDYFDNGDGKFRLERDRLKSQSINESDEEF
jgi:hypothetical protein